MKRTENGNGTTDNTLQAIRFSRDTGLELLDQRLLPFTESWHTISNAQDAHDAIKSMLVRGAPAIGVTAALGIAVELISRLSVQVHDPYESPASVVRHVEEMRELLNVSRPTAVNLFDATDRLVHVAREHAATHDDDKSNDNNDTDISPASRAIRVAQAVIDSAEQYMMEDIKINKTIGNFGADVVFQWV